MTLLTRPGAARLTYLRDLTAALVSRELKVRYKGSVLGVFWSLLTPLAQLVVFTLLFRNVLKLDIANYPLFVFVGVLAWSWFQSSLLLAAGAITDNRELVRRPGFPSLVLPAVTVATNFIQYLLALPILAGVVVFSDVTVTSAALLLPLLLGLQFLLTLGLAYLVASVNVLFRDVQHLLAVALNLLFYLTPIFYAAESVPERFRFVTELNPLAWLLGAQRDVLIAGRLPDAAPLLGVTVLSAALLALGLLVFRRTRDRFAEEL